MDLLKIEYHTVISSDNAHFIFTDMIYCWAGKEVYWTECIVWDM